MNFANSITFLSLVSVAIAGINDCSTESFKVTTGVHRTQDLGVKASDWETVWWRYVSSLDEQNKEAPHILENLAGVSGDSDVEEDGSGREAIKIVEHFPGSIGDVVVDVNNEVFDDNAGCYDTDISMKLFEETVEMKMKLAFNLFEEENGNLGVSSRYYGCELASGDMTEDEVTEFCTDILDAHLAKNMALFKCVTTDKNPFACMMKLAKPNKSEIDLNDPKAFMKELKRHGKH